MLLIHLRYPYLHIEVAVPSKSVLSSPHFRVMEVNDAFGLNITWEVEKAELQARIAFLQGERKGQENLKNDLVRRIKMLEYALKQERAKYAKLKYGGDGGDIGPPPQDEDGVELPALEQGDNMIAVTNSNWRQGRQLLRQYLQEIGYTGTFSVLTEYIYSYF